MPEGSMGHDAYLDALIESAGREHLTGVHKMINGTVEAKSNKFDKHSILVDGNWYSSKFEIKAERGDVVEFDNGGEGKKYCSKLKVVSKGSGAPSGTAMSSGTAKPAYSRGAFPVPQLDGSRAIIRQNAVTNANTFLGNAKGEHTVTDLIDLARKIEAYTSGDVEAEAVKAKISAGFDPEA